MVEHACEKDTRGKKRSENPTRMLSNRGTTVPDRLIRDEARIRNLIHANRPRIRINSFHRPSAGLNFDRLSRLVSFVSPPPPTPSSLRSLQFSNDISLSIPLSRNLYPRPRRVNRTVSSYSVSSSGRRQPGRRVELVCLAVIPLVVCTASVELSHLLPC